MVINKPIFPNDTATNLSWGKFDYKVTMPSDETKTRVDYCWLIPVKKNWFITLWKDLDICNFKSDKHLYDQLDYWYGKIRKDAGVPAQFDEYGGKYNMRSVRCYHATKWVRTVADYKFMEWDDPPPNPLQHVKPTLTKATYAEEGADNTDAAMRRCLFREKTRDEAITILRRKNINVEQLLKNLRITTKG